MRYILSSLFLPIALGFSKENAEQTSSKKLTTSSIDQNISSPLKKKAQILSLIQEKEVFRAMSFNVLWQNESTDSLCPCSWNQRKEQVASMIRFHKADIIGLQEPLDTQIQDLIDLLPDYDFYGIGWEDGQSKGPIDAILWKKSRFTRKEEGYFFLSPTPDTPSKGWNAKFPRGVTWVKVKDKKTGKYCYIFNTHFDYHSEEARHESASLLRMQIEKIAKGECFVVTGDFNLFPEMGAEETYGILTSSEHPGSSLIDAKNKALFPHHGPTGTWSGFKEAGQPGVKPDFIFVSERIGVMIHGVLSDCFDGLFPSDHLPVVADLFIMGKNHKNLQYASEKERSLAKC